MTTIDQHHHFLLRTFDNRFVGCGSTPRFQMQHLEALYQHVESQLARMTDEERATVPDMLTDEARRLAEIETPHVAEAYLALGGRRWPLTWEHRARVEQSGQLDLLVA